MLSAAYHTLLGKSFHCVLVEAREQPETMPFQRVTLPACVVAVLGVDLGN